MKIQIIKRADISARKIIGITILAILLAFVLIGVYLGILGYHPLTVYGAMIEGSLLSVYNFQQTIIKAIPILICALGLSIAFKMNFWNIGAEGQMLMGGLGATYIALNYDTLPSPVLIIVMMIAGTVLGAAWAFLPGFFHTQWKTNETIVTLMLNYIAVKLVTYLQYGPWKDPGARGFPKIKAYPTSATLPSLFGIHIGWIIALVLVVLVSVYMNHSKLGFESTVIGESQQTANYVGIPIRKTILISVCLSGAICGFSGVIQMAGVSKTFSAAMTGDAGNIAIIVAWLSNLKPSVMLVVSVAFAALLAGGEYIGITHDVPTALASVIQAAVLFCVLGSAFFSKYKVILKKETK